MAPTSNRPKVPGVSTLNDQRSILRPTDDPRNDRPHALCRDGLYALCMIGPSTLAAWHQRISGAARAGLPPATLALLEGGEEGEGGVQARVAKVEAFIARFADDAGHRRKVDEPFLRYVLLRGLGVVTPAAALMPEMSNRSDSTDAPSVWFWRALADEGPARRWLESRLRPGDIVGGPFPSNEPIASYFPAVDVRALAPEMREESVETWTENELSCLHALSWMPEHQERAEDAAAWLVKTLQPDNGTNHPWGIHVFAAGECLNADADAGMYAQTLLHNAVVGGGGVPDLFSALILWDAAAWLKTHM